MNEEVDSYSDESEAERDDEDPMFEGEEGTSDEGAETAEYEERVKAESRTSGGKGHIEEKARKKKRTPGVVYLSRIPPYMKPHKLKKMLSPYGEVGRLYLRPEDENVRHRRMKFGGSKKRNFTEGWVEFLDKRVAKAVAMALNTLPIGGKKRNYYHDDLWNIRYLPHFRWTDLTDQKVYEQAVKQQQMRTEMSQAKRENKVYMNNRDKGKAISAIVKRKLKHGATEEEVMSKHKRQYKQRKLTASSQHHQPSSLSSSSSLATEGKSSGLSDSLLKKILLH